MFCSVMPLLLKILSMVVATEGSSLLITLSSLFWLAVPLQLPVVLLLSASYSQNPSHSISTNTCCIRIYIIQQ